MTEASKKFKREIWWCFCNSQDTTGVTPYSSFSSCFLMFFFHVLMKLTRIYQFSTRLNDSGIKQNFSMPRLQAASKPFCFFPHTFWLSLCFGGKKSRICQIKTCSALSPEKIHASQLVCFLQKTFQPFQSVLSPGAERSSFPVHSSSLAWHIALVKSCSTQWNKYPLKIIFRWK